MNQTVGHHQYGGQLRGAIQAVRSAKQPDVREPLSTMRCVGRYLLKIRINQIGPTNHGWPLELNEPSGLLLVCFVFENGLKALGIWNTIPRAMFPWAY